MTLHPLPAFSDNYIWILHDGAEALVVDPGEADGVLQYLQDHGLTLGHILITHHHPDHTGGVARLRDATGAAVVGPARESMPEPLRRVAADDFVSAMGLDFQVIEVPGHTSGHIAYYAADFGGKPLLFCGDTLFSGGCGRLFEGTPAQMLDSLTRLAALPDDTRVCCTHEYTLANLRFAQAVEPGNAELAAYTQHCQQVRARNLPTLPSSIGLEKQINPFLRSTAADVVRAAQTRQAGTAGQALAVFTTLREWKNNF